MLHEPRPAIVWDLDGTLVTLDIRADDCRDWGDRLTERFAAHGWTGRFSPLLPTLERALDHIAERLPAEEARQMRVRAYDDLDEWEADALRGVEVINRTAAMFAEWALRGIPMAIVTNTGPSVTARALSELAAHSHKRGLLPVKLAAVVHRGPEVRAKPSSEGMARALAALMGARFNPPSDLVLLGDRPADWEAAAALERGTALPVWSLAVDDGFVKWPPTSALPSGSPTPRQLLIQLGLWGE